MKINRNNIETIVLAIMAIIIFSIIVIGVLMLQGCSCNPETIIRDRIITVTPPAIHDTVGAVILDTVIVGTNIVKTDTIAIIKYFPKWKFFDYKIRPDTIKLVVQDTINQTKIIEKNIETPFLSKVGIFTLGLIAGAAILIFIRLKLTA